MAALYRVGERVDGLYDENADDMWYPGRIRCVHPGEAETGSTFEVVYDDGEVEMNVRPEFLRQHVPGTICVGTRVLCRYDGGEEFYAGQVSDVQENGNYTIAYDDGEVEEDVPLDHIMEPEGEEDKEAGEDAEANEENEPREATDDPPPEGTPQQEDEEAEMEEQDPPLNPVDNTVSKATASSENQEHVDRENHSDEPVTNEPLADVQPPRAEQFQDDEPPANAVRNGDHPDPTPTGASAEREYIVESLQLLEKRLGDSASTKSVLSTLVKQMRAYPQLTADLVHERGGERLIVDALKFHQSHAVIQCYGFVLLRRLCFLCVKSTHLLLRNGIVELVIQAMNAFAEDAILQASACGALAVFTRVQAGLNILIEYQIAQLVLSTLIYHKTYSVHTRQVHYYACEVLLELCELDDLQTINLLCGEQEEDFTGDMAPISLLLFLLRQGLSLDDKKACCAVGSLLMCLAASGRRAAALVLSLNGLAELSTVMARYPTEPSIQKYSAAASKQIALSSVRQSPTKRIKDTAKEILREAESLENAPTDRAPAKRSGPRRSTSTGKRKSNPTAGYGAPAYPRGASSTAYRSAQGVASIPSPYAQPSPRFGGETNSFGYPARDFGASATAPQPHSSLVILDGSLGLDNGAYGSTSKRKQLSKEDRQSELFDAYGIQEIPDSVSNGRPYGTKRAQLRAHLASAESAWATPQPYGHSASKPYSSRSEHLDHGSAYAQREFLTSRQNGWEYDSDEPQNSVYDPDLRQPRGAKRKKKNPGARTAFQVKLENENQLRVSRETRSPYPSPQRLGAATKRAAKARQKRITAGGNSTLTGRANNASSESLNDYATQLFQENASRAGSGIPSSSKLTPREKEEIRERERLSFAEKLHKMIDKAKSTLANGNTVSVAPVGDARRTQKSATSSKPARKARDSQAAPSQDKRPQSKKTRIAVSSPRDAAEPRPPKPAPGTSKRQQDAGSQLTPAALQVPTSSRTKPSTSRPVLPPKITTDSKPRSAAKPSKTTTTKVASKRGGEKSNVETVPTETAQYSIPAVDEPHQVEKVAAELALSTTQLSEESVAAQLAVAEQVEPELSTNGDGVQEEEVAVPLETATASETERSTVEPGADQLTQLPGDVEREVVATPVEVEVVAPRVDERLTKEEGCVPVPGADAVVEAATELPDPSVETQQPTETPTEEPSAELQAVDDHPATASAITDAMYGDTFSEFDDNGGDDEDATTEAGADTDDAHSIVTEMADPATDAPLQESKSGEALYDGYDEFDEDEAPNTEDVDAEDAPVAETAESQDVEVSDVISQPTEDVPAPAVIASEAEAEHLVAQNEDPSAVVEEAVLAAPTEGDEGDADNSLPLVEVDRMDEAELPEESHVLESDEANTEDVTQSAQSDSDPVVSNTSFGEQDESKPTSEGTSSMVTPTGESLSEETPSDQERMRVDETTDDVTASERVENIPIGEDGVESEAEPRDSNLDAGTESAGENAESSAQSAAIEDEDPSVNPPDETGASLDLASEETAAEFINGDQEKEAADTDVHADAVDESAPSMEQDEESKTLSADHSNLSVQSAAYDEENFDDEESHQEEKPSEAEGIDLVVAANEDGVDVVNPEQSDEDAEPMDTNVETASDDPSAPEQGEEEPKTLAANSSEVSVQYEDEEFDDGAHDESQHEQETDDSAEQEPSEDDVTKNGELDEPVDDALPAGVSGEEEKLNEMVADDGASVPESPENEGLETEDLPDEQKVELLAVAEPSEQQQPQCDDSTADSVVVAEPSSAPTTSEAPDTMAEEEIVNNVQVPAVNDADTFVDDPVDAEELTHASETVAAATEAPVEVSDPLPASVESPAESSSTAIDSLETEAPEIAIPSELTQEEVVESPEPSAQPATYDDDDFDNGAEDEDTPPSAATLDSTIITEGFKDEDLKSDVLSSEQAIDGAGRSPIAAIEDATHEPTEVAETSLESEPEQSDESAPSPPEGAVGLGVDLVEADDSVSDVTPEAEFVPADAVEEAGDPAELPTPDVDANVNSATDGANSPVPDVASLEPELPTEGERLGDDQGVASPEEDSDVHSVSEGAEDADAAEQAPELEAQSITPVEADGDEASVETDLGALAQESDPVSAGFSDPSVEDAHKETQYADAEFEEAGNDAPGLKDVSLEHELVQSDEAAPADSTVADDIASDQAAPAEENAAAVNGDSEVVVELGVSDVDEAPALLAEVPMNDDGEVSDATANAVGDEVEGSDQQRTDAAADADELNELVPDNAEDARTAAGSELDDTPEPALDGTAYAEDFPPDIPLETQGDASVDEATASVGIEDVSNMKDTVTGDENNAVKPSEYDEAHAVAESTDVAPGVASNDEGSGDDKNPPTADPSATCNEVESGPAVEEEPVNDADASTVEEATSVDINAGPEAVDTDTENCDAASVVAVETTLDTDPEKLETEAVDLPVVEHEDHASEANELEAALTEAVEPEAVKSEIIESEADKAEHIEPEVVSSEATVETEDAEAAASEVSAPEATECDAVSAAHPVEESASAEPQEAAFEAVEPEVAQPETLEAEAVETHVVDPEADEREQFEAVESTTADEASPTSEPPMEEGSSTEPALEVSAVPEAKEEDAVAESPEVPTSLEPVVSDNADIPSTEGDLLDVPDEAAEPTEDAVAPKEEEERTDKDVIDNPSVAVESPVEAEHSAVLHAEGSTLEADVPATSRVEEPAVSEADPVASADADKPEVAGVNDEATKASPDEITPEPTPAEDEQSSGQPEYDEADFADEPPAAAVDEVVQNLPEASAEAPREEPVVQEDVLEASEEVAIEVEPPQSDQAAAEASPPAASEAPKTEDQYDDDEGYFDDQESAAPVAVPSLEIPAPAVDAPATEDDYEEYENEDYGEEDKPAPRSQPPVSAREEEVEEVADEPEEAEEEAYADEQDEYNNEYDDDEAAASPRTKKDQPPAQVEASADEYEEEEEEYAEDEIEDSSPSPASKSKPAAAAPPAKSDDEMDEEVGYDSEYGSDG